jgi:fibronectin type 3 domain-containing protein
VKTTLTYGRALTPAPVEASLYEDTTAAADASYCYVVRTAVSSEPLVESEASNEACLDVLDVKAPEAPTGLATLADASGIEVSWSPSSEQDLALYRLYRAPARGGASEKLADVPPPSTSFKDVAARPGVRFKYSLTALDKAGNESEPSLPAEGGR